jgi:orotidine-5'-phosphate decarboxylase
MLKVNGMEKVIWVSSIRPALQPGDSCTNFRELKLSLVNCFMQQIIKTPKSVIPACDVPIDIFRKLLMELGHAEEIGGFKIGGIEPTLENGLPAVVQIAKEYTDKPLIFDYQKAATDIPEKGERFARVCYDSGVDAVILYPQSGFETEMAWIKAAQDAGLGVIVGMLMSHKGFLDTEGGLIREDRILDTYTTAAKMGVTDFILPGTKLKHAYAIMESLRPFASKPTYYTLGVGVQGADLQEAKRVIGDLHAIVGRTIYENPNPRAATLELARVLA